MSLTTIVDGAVTLCDGIRLLQSLNSSFRNDENRQIHIICTLNRLAILSLNMGASVSKAKKIDPEKIENLKSFELLSRVMDIPLRLKEYINEIDENQIEPSFSRFLGKVILAPLSGIIKTHCEMEIAKEQGYLKAYEEKGNEAKRPIYKYDDTEDTANICDYAPVNPEECKQTIKTLENQANFFGALKVTQEIGIKNILKAPRALYEELNLFLRFRSSLCSMLDSDSPANTQPVINLLASELIPDPLHDDPVFNRYQCAISHMPIRDPVGDPTNNITLYERRFIVRWLRVHPTSPITRKTLRVSELVEKPALKLLIDNRLKFHETHLKDYLNTSGVFNTTAIVDPGLQANTDIENPRN